MFEERTRAKEREEDRYGYRDQMRGSYNATESLILYTEGDGTKQRRA